MVFSLPASGALSPALPPSQIHEGLILGVQLSLGGETHLAVRSQLSNGQDSHVPTVELTFARAQEIPSCAGR